MRIMAGGAFNLEAIAAVVDPDFPRIRPAVTVQIEELDAAARGCRQIEVDAGPSGRGKSDADRVIVAQVRADREHGEIGCHFDAAGAGMAAHAADGRRTR